MVKQFIVCDVCNKIIREAKDDSDYHIWAVELYKDENSPFGQLDWGELDKLFEIEVGDDNPFEQDTCSFKCAMGRLSLKQAHVIGAILADMSPQWNKGITLEFDYCDPDNRRIPWAWGELFNNEFECWGIFEDEDELHLEDN